MSDFLSDSKESSLFMPAERRELEKEVLEAQQHCQDLLLNMETGEISDPVRRGLCCPEWSFYLFFIYLSAPSI